MENTFVDSLVNQLMRIKDDLIAYLPQLVIGIVVGIVLFIVVRRIRGWVRNIMTRLQTPQGVQLLLVNVIYFTAMFISVTITLGVLGVDVSGLIAGLGVSGLVLGFALQGIIGNMVSGVLLLINRPFHVGDLVEINGHKGFVKDVELRATTLRTQDNEEIIIPNATVYDSVIKNNVTHHIIRRHVSIGLGYGEDLRTAIDHLLARVAAVEGVESDPAPVVMMQDFGDSAMLGMLFYHVNSRTQHPVHSEVVIALHEVVKEQGIDIPYPHRTIIQVGNSSANN